MAEQAFVLFSALSVALVSVTAVHAYPDRRRLTVVGSGVVYGVVLEQLTIINFEAYTYPAEPYLLAVADVPLAIGLSWAAILYAGLVTARRGGLSGIGVPLFVGLFALHIDLAMDAVAIRVGYWQWTGAGPWFGVPLGNFVGWFWVAFCFAGWWTLADEIPRFSNRSDPLSGVLGVVVPTTALIAVLYVHEWYLWPALGTVVPIAGTVVLAVAALTRADWQPHRPSPLVVAVPVAMHMFFIGLAITFGMSSRLVVLGLAMLGVTVLLHAPSGAGERSRPTSAD